MTTEIEGRAILYENATTRKYGIHTSCNACDRIIFEDEMTAQEYTGNGGYCPECEKEIEETNNTNN
jgi:hypothetical protein